MESSSATQLVYDLEKFCGSWAHLERADEFILAFQKCHNTHQQNIFRMILKLIEFMASDDFRVDGRNAQSKQVAQQMLAGFLQANPEGCKLGESLSFI